MFPIVKNYTVTIGDLTVEQVKKAANVHFSSGITTTQDIILNFKESLAYKRLGNDLPIDVNSYVWINSRSLDPYYDTLNRLKTDRVKIKGIKLIFDGSIQAYTALMTKPYWTPPKKSHTKYQ